MNIIFKVKHSFRHLHTQNCALTNCAHTNKQMRNEYWVREISPELMGADISTCASISKCVSLHFQALVMQRAALLSHSSLMGSRTEQRLRIEQAREHCAWPHSSEVGVSPLFFLRRRRPAHHCYRLRLCVCRNQCHGRCSRRTTDLSDRLPYDKNTVGGPGVRAFDVS